MKYQSCELKVLANNGKAPAVINNFETKCRACKRTLHCDDKIEYCGSVFLPAEMLPYCENCISEVRMRTARIRISTYKREHADEIHKAEVEKLKHMPYGDYLKTGHWQTLRKKKLRKAKGRCRECGTKYQILHVHHKTYERRGEERLDDLVVLCAKCHAKAHSH